MITCQLDLAIEILLLETLLVPAETNFKWMLTCLGNYVCMLWMGLYVSCVLMGQCAGDKQSYQCWLCKWAKWSIAKSRPVNWVELMLSSYISYWKPRIFLVTCFILFDAPAVYTVWVRLRALYDKDFVSYSWRRAFVCTLQLVRFERWEESVSNCCNGSMLERKLDISLYSVLVVSYTIVL